MRFPRKKLLKDEKANNLSVVKAPNRLLQELGLGAAEKKKKLRAQLAIGLRTDVA